MGFKIKNYGRAHIVGAALPNHADTYTVIKHEDVINLCINELEQAGFNIIGETYRATSAGDIATGVYKVTYGNDPDLGIMLAWTNSYNKQVAFNCTSGAYVVNSGNLMIGNYGTLNKFRRKHTGTADEDTENSIKDQITHAKMHFASLAEDKKKMEAIKLNRTEQAELLGILFAREDLLTPRQATIVKKLMNKPNFFYGGGSDSLWTYYNYVSEALQDTHPIRWLIDQRFFHEFIRDFMDLDNVDVVNSTDNDLTQIFFNGENPLAQIDDLTGCPPVDPNQVDLEEAIAEVEAEATEDEVADQLYGVNNNPEEVIGDFTPEPTIEEQIEEDEAAIAEVESREGLQEYFIDKTHPMYTPSDMDNFTIIQDGEDSEYRKVLNKDVDKAAEDYLKRMDEGISEKESMDVYQKELIDKSIPVDKTLESKDELPKSEEETPSEMNDIDVTKLKIDPTAFKANVTLDNDFDFGESEEEESAEADFDF